MGQQESSGNPNSDFGFGAQPQRRKKTTDVTEKSSDKPVLPETTKDSYFQFAAIRDVINPLFLTAQNAPDAQPAGLPDTLDIAGALRNLLRKQSTKEAKEASSDALTESSLSDSSAEEGVIGKYHKDVKREAKEEDVLVGSSHPIKIKGHAQLGSILRAVDGSKWAGQYRVYKYEWFVSSAVAVSKTFEEASLSEGDTFTLPTYALGRYVQVVASRRVEDVTRGAGFRAGGADYQDAFVRGGKKDIRPDVYREVKSAATVGPVLVAETWASAILATLASSDPSVIRFHKEKFTVTTVRTLNMIETAAEDEDYDRVKQLIEKGTCTIVLSFSKKLDYITMKFTEGRLQDRLLRSKSDYLWFEMFRVDSGKGDTYKLDFKSVQFGLSNAGYTTSVPVLSILPEEHKQSAEPLLLTTHVDENTLWEVGSHDQDITFLFCLICTLKAALKSKSYETKSHKFPSSPAEWAKGLVDEDVTTVQRLLQRYLSTHFKDGVLSAMV